VGSDWGIIMVRSVLIEVLELKAVNELSFEMTACLNRGSISCEGLYRIDFYRSFGDWGGSEPESASRQRASRTSEPRFSWKALWLKWQPIADR
jgi:hypothetical protein